MYTSSSTLGSMRCDGNAVVGEPRESLGVDKVDTSFYLLFLSPSRCCYVPVSRGLNGFRDRKNPTAIRPGRQDQAMRHLILQSGPVIRTLATCGPEVKSVLVRLVNR